MPPVPSLIELELLKFPSRASQPASTQQSSSLSNDAPDLLTKEHVPFLQQFFHLVVGEPAGGLAGTPTTLTRKSWHLMEAYCARREYALRTAPASWVDLVHPRVCRDVNDLSRGHTGVEPSALLFFPTNLS